MNTNLMSRAEIDRLVRATDTPPKLRGKMLRALATRDKERVKIAGTVLYTGYNSQRNCHEFQLKDYAIGGPTI